MYTMLKMPVACLLLVAYSFFYYWKNKKLRTRASDVFVIMVVMVICNLVADVVTEFTVNNRDVVPEPFNYVWHVIFLLSMLSVCFLMYYYVVSYIERVGSYKKAWEKRWTAVVWAVCALGILLLPIRYVDTIHGSYSLGGKVYVLYAGTIYTLALVAYNIFRYGKAVAPEKRNVICMSAAIFATFAVVQIVFPYILVTGLGMSLMLMGIMMTAESPYQYYNRRTGFYSELGLREFAGELLYWKKEFVLVAYVYYGNAGVAGKSVSQAVAYMSERFQTVNFQLADYCVAFLLPEGAKAAGELDEIFALEKHGDDAGERYQVFQYDGRSTTDEVIQELYDFKEKYGKAELYYDELTKAMRRGAFTQYATEKLSGEHGIAMLMLDVDDFKSINDRFGHFVGDQVLQAVAHALKKSVRGLDVVGRMGGDEFAVLLVDVESESDVEEVVKRLNARINRICRENGHLDSVKEAEGRADADERYVHVSVGGRLHMPSDGEMTFERLYVEADKALYKAKERGKNCYEINGGCLQ